MTWISTTRFLHTENASTFFLPYLRRSRAVLPKAHAFELAVEGLALDAEDLCGAALVSAAGGQGAADLVRFGGGDGVPAGLARIWSLGRFPHSGVLDAGRRLQDCQ